MARPLKTKVKLKRVVGVRVDDATYAGWKERAADAGVPIGEWARNRIIQGKAVRQSRRRELPAADPKLLAAIARVGNNVNQIARAGNQAGFRRGCNYSNNSSRLSARCTTWSRRHDDLVQHRRRIWRRRGRLPRRRKRPCRQKA